MRNFMIRVAYRIGFWQGYIRELSKSMRKEPSQAWRIFRVSRMYRGFPFWKKWM